MQKTRLLCLVFYALVISTSVWAQPQTAQARFSIQGTLSGIPDGTTLVLTNMSTKPRTFMDSTSVANGQFSFAWRSDNLPIQVMLHTPNYSEYTYFWIDSNPVTFKAEKGKFKQAEIRGSRAHDEEVAFLAKLKPIIKQRDSLDNLLEKKPDEPLKSQIIAASKDAASREKSQRIDLIQQNPHSIISASWLNIFSKSWGKEQTQTLFELLSPAMQNSVSGKEIAEYLRLNQNLQIGDSFAPFTQSNPEGQSIHFADVAQGKVVLLDFWAAWCSPCRAQHPNLIRLYEQHHPKGFEIVSVSLDDEKEAWLEAIAQDKLTWTNVCDLRGDKNAVALIYGVSGIPNNVLIDRQGKIVARNIHGKTLEEKLATLLK